MSPEAISEVLTEAAPHLGRFIARLFQNEPAWEAQGELIRDEDQIVFGFRNEFIAPLTKKYKGVAVDEFDQDQLKVDAAAMLNGARIDARLQDDDEYLMARAAAIVSGRLTPPLGYLDALRKEQSAWSGLDDESLLEAACLSLEKWCVCVKNSPDFAPFASNSWVSFKQPAKTDFAHLIHYGEREHGNYKAWAAESGERRRRDGFSLTDQRFELRQVLYEVDHCIYCHDRDNDTCSKGMPDKKNRRLLRPML